MTPAQRITLIILAVFAALWLVVRGCNRGDQPAPTMPATPTASVTAAATSSPTPPSAPPGYRLAGVAIGVATSYAAIEAPGGSSNLYRLNAEVPGLGRLLRIDGERVIIGAKGGDFEMWVAPAPTPSITVTRRPAVRLTPTRAPNRAEDASPSLESSP